MGQLQKDTQGAGGREVLCRPEPGAQGTAQPYTPMLGQPCRPRMT